MSRPPVRVIVGAAIAILVVVLIVQHRRSAEAPEPAAGSGALTTSDVQSPSPSPSPAANATDAAPDTSAAIDPDSDPVDAPEPPSSPPRLSPTAAWLAASPTPIAVSAAIDDSRPRQQTISPAGGELSISTRDGTRILLTIPPGALARSVEIGLAAVTDVSGSGFAGGMVAGVRVTPDDLTLRTPATLVFETRQPVPREQLLAGFAVRAGRELHLYPAFRLDDPKLRGRARVVVPLGRLGTYGIANATPQETAAAARHEPTGFAARLEQLIAQAFPPVVSAQVARLWNVMPVAHAQDASAPAWLDQLIQALVESFEQVVVALFKAIPSEGCLVGPTELALKALREWSVMPTLLFPVDPPAKDMPPAVWLQWQELVQQREDMLHARGYSDEQIAQIDAAMNDFRRATLREFTLRAMEMVGVAYRLQFQNAYRCCLSSEPRQYQLTAMYEVLHLAAVDNVGPADDNPSPKLDECNCRIAAARQGAEELFTGTITQTENYEAERRESIANRTTMQATKMSYEIEVRVQEPIGRGQFVGRYTVNGSVEFDQELKDQRSCGVIAKVSHQDAQGSDNGATTVHIEAVPKQPGTYHISYAPQAAEAWGSRRWHWSARGCQIFNPERSDQGTYRYPVITQLTNINIEAQVDPSQPNTLTGSREFEMKDDVYAKPHRSRVEFDLRRCNK